MRFVDIRNDVAFHKIFGNANKTITLISFLNAVMNLEGLHKIVSVTIENPFLYPIVTGGKLSVLDIRATDQEGRKFIVEMQVADKEGFLKRAQYYASRDFSIQIDRGDDYPLLKPTFFIGILDFEVTQGKSYYSQHKTIDIETGEHLLQEVQYFFIELPKFQKNQSELENLMDKWTYFLKNVTNLEVIPDNVDDEGLKIAYLEADKHAWTKNELLAYDDAAVRERDLIQEKLFILNKAHKEGLEKGLEEGMEKGMEKGAEKKEIEAILGFHQIGISIENISQALKISIEKVRETIENNSPNT